MLSYRHAYHAGNHADVLKHFTLYTILNYYNQKDKPYWYIDTHAGAGLYDLHSSEANKVGEYQQGIARLWAAGGQPESQQPASLAAFAQFAQTLAAHETMTQLYAGSPLWAAKLLRPADKLRDYSAGKKNKQHTCAQNNNCIAFVPRAQDVKQSYSIQLAG